MPGLTCKDETRRQAVRDSELNGIDYIEVLCPDQRYLCVHLFAKGLESIGTANVRIEGGTRIRDIRVESVEILNRDDPELGECLSIRLDRAGDFSTYTLGLVKVVDGKATDQVPDGFDPRYASAEFSFKVCCDTEIDCKEVEACPPEIPEEPVIDYLAKDYAGFRQLILDRLALVMPDWKERHIPDLGVALVEVFAYAGDDLSYYQDAVATEAYLDTARQRISIRRHARLVDYAVHEGCNARAFVCIETGSDITDLDPAEMFFITGYAGSGAAPGKVLHVDDLIGVPASDYEVFEPLGELRGPVRLLEAHNAISFYTWGNRECCLPKGSTRATLMDEWADEHPSPEQEDTAGAEDKPEKPVLGGGAGEKLTVRRRKLDLKAGDLLVFEEVIGPETGNKADADPDHRQAVRLTGIDRDADPLTGRPVLNIEWAHEDALAFPLCLSARLPAPDCTFIDQVSVARGNVMLVDHGKEVESEDLGTVGAASLEGECTCGGPADIIYLPERFRAVLHEKPVTFRQEPDPEATASAMMRQDPRKALPVVRLDALPGTKTGGPVAWHPRQDLLESDEEDAVFVVEIDNEGCARIRFGDGEQGKMPEAGTSFSARYRVGNGPAGNVGAGTIRHLVLRKKHASGISVRNPLPASGGTPQEPMDEVRLTAPFMYRKKLERAIIAADYAAIAERNPKLQKAAAALRWSGSWYEAQVSVDPYGTAESGQKLHDEIEGNIYPYRRMGHDVAVVPAEYVPLELTLSVCVEPDFVTGHVKAALLDRFSNRVQPDGTFGFFHPDRLTFGRGMAVTSVTAAAQAIPGVRCVHASIKRLGEPDANALEDGILPLGPMEIARLENDPSFPENGRLILVMEGGR